MGVVGLIASLIILINAAMCAWHLASGNYYLLPINIAGALIGFFMLADEL